MRWSRLRSPERHRLTLRTGSLQLAVLCSVFTVQVTGLKQAGPEGVPLVVQTASVPGSICTCSAVAFFSAVSVCQTTLTQASPHQQLANARARLGYHSCYVQLASHLGEKLDAHPAQVEADLLSCARSWPGAFGLGVRQPATTGDDRNLWRKELSGELRPGHAHHAPGQAQTPVGARLVNARKAPVGRRWCAWMRGTGPFSSRRSSAVGAHRGRALPRAAVAESSQLLFGGAAPSAPCSSISGTAESVRATRRC
jgi:hypothetical protein